MNGDSVEIRSKSNVTEFIETGAGVGGSGAETRINLSSKYTFALLSKSIDGKFENL